ncbi:MAG: aminopeptidase P N-terminal domain-containing protein, partial [Aquirufa sp.]
MKNWVYLKVKEWHCHLKKLFTFVANKMRYTPFSAELFKNNRAKLYAQLPPKSIVVVSSNDIMPTNADGTMGFRQNSDLFYLSGLDQEECFLILYPDAPEPQWREIAFVRETSELIEIWEGHKYTKEEATQTSGIKNIQWSSNFDTLLKILVYSANHIYLTDNEHLRNASVVQTQNARLGINIRNTYPNHAIGRLAPILSDLRMQKEPEELQAMQVACDITEKGFRRVLNFTKPGVTEYEIEAEFIHEFTRNRSEGFAYTPIIASGANACVLHYATNAQLATTQSRINTGLKISSAKDNGAIWAIAQGQRADIGALNAVKQSLDRGIAATDVARAAGETVSDLLLQMKEKALAASDKSLKTAARAALNED